MNIEQSQCLDKARENLPALIAAFGKHFAATGLVPRENHRYLIHAFDERNIADYETEQNLTSEDVGEKIKHATQFLEHAERMLNAET